MSPRNGVGPAQMPSADAASPVPLDLSATPRRVCHSYRVHRHSVFHLHGGAPGESVVHLPSRATTLTIPLGSRYARWTLPTSEIPCNRSCESTSS